MKRIYEAEMAEFLNGNGEFFGRSFGSGWIAPDSVALSNGRLTIRGTLEYWSRDRGRSIKGSLGLLDSFVRLGDASDQTTAAGLLMKGTSPSDENIRRFAQRYGGLRVFCQFSGRPHWPDTEHIEHCHVWRYFARVMRSLLQIGGELYRGSSGSQEHWGIISATPPVMRAMAHKSNPGLLYPFPLSDEENWVALAHFVARKSQQNRVMLGHLLNTLIGLGGVRPWLTWPETTRQVARPKIAYFGRSLLSELALQLCLRLAKVDSFLVCVHCQQPYSPEMRAPKVGQRNFCPKCRTDGVPKKYALKDFRERQRLEKAVGGYQARKID